jgi:hypothetical protein
MAKKKKKVAKKKVAKRIKNPPRVSVGTAKKAVLADCITLALAVCDALEEKGAERGKLGMILPEDLILDLGLQEGEHFTLRGSSCVSIPHLIPPVALVKLARKLHLTRESPDQEEGTYTPLDATAWIHLYPELL